MNPPTNKYKSGCAMGAKASLAPHTPLMTKSGGIMSAVTAIGRASVTHKTTTAKNTADKLVA
jgi:hypothetical protein